ncbi:putative F-box protein At1g30925 [Capsella rubella]|uniref:putative F-box protein At1g30925 n=1 Tax=Capsella rubella TaxID=81985 RepID=UPI000CD4A821|nr:putative F-box protein At1g30925 [Capsella rubella]
MDRGILSSFPSDLIPEILSRLPAKSIGRFRCVSKQWGSILSRQDFPELFFTRSLARPRLLLVLQRANGELLVFSSPQPQNPYEKSLVVTADFHMKLRGHMLKYNMCSYASGLIYVPDYEIFENLESVNGKEKEGVICNPALGQFLTLPIPNMIIYRKSTSFLGFDPVDEQFKVLAEADISSNDYDHHGVLTFGTEKLRWRGNNHCPHYYRFSSQGICINGVLYYLADTTDEFSDLMISFDVKSEKFKFIEAECFRDRRATRLINYKGKLGGIDLTYDDDDAVVLTVSVLEDVEKKEWSKYVYTLPKHEVQVYNVFVAGMTARGEIVLAEKFTSKPYNVFFYNPEKNSLQSVEIQGVGANGEAFETDCRVFAFVDHVEDISLKTQVQLYKREDGTDEDEDEDDDEDGYEYGYEYEDGYGYEDGYEDDIEDEAKEVS